MKAKFAIGTILVFACAAAFAGPTLDLDLTVRDFHESHPDMQYIITGVETGIVNTALGGDYKPVYSGAPGIVSVSNSGAYFDQWYNDTPGVNQTYLRTITLEDDDFDGVYTYYNAEFFPIDLGCPSHNYHFTVEAHAEFTYDVVSMSTMVLEYGGDDDIWVFINGSLVIDLGGVHAFSTGTVNLGSLGLMDGSVYDVDIFFAERHTVDSAIKLELPYFTDVPIPEPASMMVLGLGSLVLRRIKRT